MYTYVLISQVFSFPYTERQSPSTSEKREAHTEQGDTIFDKIGEKGQVRGKNPLNFIRIISYLLAF